ncbi:hypothetical protein Tco_0018302 [Tanacetum coccineum]
MSPHPTSEVDYDDEYQQDDVHKNSEDPLVSAMLLLAKAITQNFFNPTNNRLRALSNTINQAIIQGDRVNIQSRNSVEKDIMLGIIQSQGFMTRSISRSIFCWQNRMMGKKLKILSAITYANGNNQPTGHTYDDGPSHESASYK